MHLCAFRALVRLHMVTGWVAQSVEQGTENPRVRGSIPFPATSFFLPFYPILPAQT